MPTTKKRVPMVHPEVEPVSLEDFDIDDIREYLRDNGDHAGRCDGDFYIPEPQMSRIETLLLCGQREHAIKEVLELAGNYLGRPF